jgi:hypothetical protein
VRPDGYGGLRGGPLAIGARPRTIYAIVTRTARLLDSPPAIPRRCLRRIGLALLTLSLVVAPLTAEAQQARQGTRVPRVRITRSNHPAVPDKDVWSIQAFLEGLGLATIRR